MNEKYYPLIKYKLQRRQLQKQEEGIEKKKIIYAFIHTLRNKEFKIIYTVYCSVSAVVFRNGQSSVLK
jgi:hypothetical protein